MGAPNRTASAASRPSLGDLFTPKLVTVLREGHGLADLRADAPAGLTVAIVALPLSMAIAIASGLPPNAALPQQDAAPENDIPEARGLRDVGHQDAAYWQRWRTPSLPRNVPVWRSKERYFASQYSYHSAE